MPPWPSARTSSNRSARMRLASSGAVAARVPGAPGPIVAGASSSLSRASSTTSTRHAVHTSMCRWARARSAPDSAPATSSWIVFSDRQPTTRYTILVALAAVFEESANDPGVRVAAPDLERRLHEILDACRAAWPGLDVPEHGFVRHLAENLPRVGDLDNRLSRMHCPDLYLACGCARRDPAALTAFDGRILSQAVPVLQRMGLSASQIDEVVQIVRTKLLIADEQGRSPLMAYAGRGPLVGWV